MQMKCVIWDLDNTIWDGVLSEENVVLKDGITEVVQELDKRGILQSIASKNDYDIAMNKLKEFGLNQFFLYPEINWNAKSQSVERIKKNLNIAMNSIAFVDDQEYERDEVKMNIPEITEIDSSRYKEFLDMECFKPKFITEDSGRRREMYLQDIQRKQDEEEYVGPKEEFLNQLNMELFIHKAEESDLKRVEELTLRTHQLNSTGIHYSYDDLLSIISDPHYELWVCELVDKYGSYGKIGITLCEKEDDRWNIKLLIMSCRTVSRGIGTVVLHALINEAHREGKRITAEFKRTAQNRPMLIAYKFSNFEVIEKKDDIEILECVSNEEQMYPSYIKVYENFRQNS